MHPEIHHPLVSMWDTDFGC